MTVVENVVETGTVVFLDDRYFLNCAYTRCTLIFSGGDFSYLNTTFTDCKINFEGPAQRTVQFLQRFNLLSPHFGKLPTLPALEKIENPQKPVQKPADT